MPRTYPVEVVTPQGTFRLDVSEEAYLLDALRQAGHDLPRSCVQGWCLICAARLQAGEVDQVDAVRHFPQDREGGVVLLCSAKPRCPLWLIIHQKASCQQNHRRLGLPTPVRAKFQDP